MIQKRDSICITGVGVVSSIGVGKEAFVSSLKAGRSGIDEIETFDTRFSRSKKAGIVRSFDPKDFIPAGKIRRLDRASQFAIAASKMALTDAGFSVTDENRDRVGVVLGSGFCGLSSSEEFHRGQVLKGFLDLNPMLFPNTVPNAASSHVSIELGIQGVNSTLVQSFCTAEAAILFACDQIRKGRADLILTGGVDELSEFLFRGFSDLRLLARDEGHGERSCPYDRTRNGIVLGEGSGVLVVEAEAHAQARGARIYGYILGYGLVGDSGRGIGVEEIRRSVLKAMRGWEGINVDYISGAGNSSKVLDAMEARGIKLAFPDGYGHIPVTSVKSMLGEAIASGGVRMVAEVLSMEHGFIPPTIHYRFPDPDCDLRYVTRPELGRQIRRLLHLGISPGDCYAAILLGRSWNP
ncbi:MAG: beta-ketoacyl-[acyl-carrier-protein] synthase family protein [Desulfobacterota bacterium]|nr:beta-ketoacyl-[acyl-carrier-protein] synthase family protein [Thermodesulfobacteriota bacterium]